MYIFFFQGKNFFENEGFSREDWMGVHILFIWLSTSGTEIQTFVFTYLTIACIYMQKEKNYIKN